MIRHAVILGIIFVLSLSSSAIAETVWISNLTISSVVASDQGVVAYTVDQQSATVQYWTNIGDSYTKMLLVALLSAQAMHSKVNLKVDDVTRRLYGVVVVSN